MPKSIVDKGYYNGKINHERLKQEVEMSNRSFAGIVVLIMIFIFSGCMEGKKKSDLYVMEEFEVASSVAIPAKRIKRLKIFLNNHPDHMCRKSAYNRIFDTIAENAGQREKAIAFLDKSIEEEKDTDIRGTLYYKEFTYLWSVDSTEAVNLATKLLESDEKGFRMFVYLGFDLGYRGRHKLAEGMFRKAMDVGANPFEKSFAGVLYGEFLSEHGKNDLALKILKESADNVFAGKQLGKILWEKGEKKAAVESYINLVSGVPGERDEVKLDSLYAIVYPGNVTELDEKILEKRISHKTLLHGTRLVDTEGKYYNLSDYKGRKLVLGVWNPT
ncbi:tetratricopeptide repeat protein [bacterium]|nr:tetratricopeptide repeat protein [bacterium]